MISFIKGAAVLIVAFYIVRFIGYIMLRIPAVRNFVIEENFIFEEDINDMSSELLIGFLSIALSSMTILFCYFVGSLM